MARVHVYVDGFNLYYRARRPDIDSDHTEPIRLVREELGLRVGVLCPGDQPSTVLCQHATFIKRIRKKHLRACQFPDTLTDANGTIHKPTTWD